MSEVAFNLVMDDLTPLFRRAMDVNYVAQPRRQLLIQYLDQITMKSCPRENRTKSGLEKKSKKNMNKNSTDNFFE